MSNNNSSGSYKFIARILNSENNQTQAEKDLKKYMKLIIKIAGPYVRTRVEYEDLIMQGILGLMRAREKYDEKRSNNFTTFASMCIRGDIYSYCQNNSTPISIPAHVLKATSYINKITKLLHTTSGNLSKDDVETILFNYRCDLEKELSKSVLENLHEFKDKIKSIANNSGLIYDSLAIIAKKALVFTISDTVLTNYHVKETSVESKASELELQEFLLESIGEKRFLVLKLHYEGYTNPEIAKILFKRGYANFKGKPISRSAVKSLLDTTMETVKNMEVFKGIDRNGKNK